MKTKYLFGMLLSGAMLAACTADDDLGSAKLTKVNPDAPVFTISLDNGDLQNRSEWVGGTSNKLTFDGNDLFSLYHGFEIPGTFASDSVKITKYGNAIYSRAGEDENGQITYGTYSMVNEGGAIMVYPADTTYVGWDSEGLTIKVPQEQDLQTRLRTPYMSEILTIGRYTEHGEKHEAGYGRTYDVVLRRAASTLSLKLNLNKTTVLPEGVEDMTVNKVALTATPSSGKKVFTTEIPVMIHKDASVARKEIGTTNVFEHDAWNHRSTLGVAEPVAGVDTLFTTDVKGDTARFTMLPNVSTGIQKGYAIVNTTYGKIEIGGPGTVEGSAIWKDAINLTKKDSTTVGQGLVNIYSVMWANARSNTFKGEPIGAHVNASLFVDEANLDMDSLHITSKKHLQDAIKVFNANFGNGDADGNPVEVAFVLDGGKNGNKPGEFEMDYATWKAVLDRIDANNVQNAKSKITFVPCATPGEACSTIVLNNADVQRDVPALQFGRVPGYENSVLKLNLKGKNWIYQSTAYNTANNSTTKNISGIQEIHVTEGADLTPAGYVATRTTDATKTPKLVIDEKGTMNVKTKVWFQVDVENRGTINITEVGELLMNAAGTTPKTLVNWAEDQSVKNSVLQKTGLSHKYGTIKNGYVLGVDEGNTNTKGKIENYGYIKVESPTATTFVTTNAGASENFSVSYGTSDGTTLNQTNKIGTIELLEPTGNLRTMIEQNGKKGFIKCTINSQAVPTYADFGRDNCIANYFVLGDKVTEVRYVLGGENNDVPQNLPTNEEIYIETSHSVALKGDFTLNGLIVDNGARVDILLNSNVGVKCFYLDNSSVYATGTLHDGSNGTAWNQNGYYGKTTGTIGKQGQ